MGQSYERLSIEEFGQQLLESLDLDPLYVALHKAELDAARLSRWLLAYWCCYSAGEASWLSEREGEDFWSGLMTAAVNTVAAPTGDRWRRAKERRHWRGQSAVKSVEYLEHRYGAHPEAMVAYCKGEQPKTTCADVVKRAKEHYLFGDWIAFKVADMIERVAGCEVSFDNANVFMFDDPRQAALRLWVLRTSPTMAWDKVKPKDEAKAIATVVTYLSEGFKEYKAPPTFDRPVGLQEVETILCKWKSHLNGHYPLRNDIIEIREGLEPWERHSETAKLLLAGLPR